MPSPLHAINAWLSAPIPFELAVILIYSVSLAVGARLLHRLGRYHFHRAQRYGDAGFKYDRENDHYRCRGNEVLPRHDHDPRRRLAVYKAPAHACNRCAHKNECTPHDHGRRVYRSLAEWAETDQARFHQWISVLMCAAGVVVPLGAMLRWNSPPDLAWLALVAAGNLFTLRL